MRQCELVCVLCGQGRTQRSLGTNPAPAANSSHRLPAHPKAYALTPDRMTDNPWQLDAVRLGSGSQGNSAFISASLMFLIRTCHTQLAENPCERYVATGSCSSGSDSRSVAWRSALSGPAPPSEESASGLPQNATCGTVAGAFLLARSQPQAPGDKLQAPKPGHEPRMVCRQVETSADSNVKRLEAEWFEARALEQVKISLSVCCPRPEPASCGAPSGAASHTLQIIGAQALWRDRQQVSCHPAGHLFWHRSMHAPVTA